MTYSKVSLYRMGDRLRAVIEEIPAWPREARLGDLARKYGYKKANIPLPADCPIAEDEGRACFVDQESKDRYLEEIRIYKESRA